MINRIIAYSVRNKLVIALFTLAIMGFGIWSITKVPVDAVPDITNNQVQVITKSPNLSTLDVEQFVSYPVERALSNLPGVVEIRSVSRFGLSLVTVVFEDDMGTYLPRQLVSEKLASLRSEIPEDFGTPELGPISTGLSEIYQYTLELDSNVAGKYDAMELRSMQDWIVRRQMAMVPGVVEVNSFGGHIKEYQVAVDPHELRAISISIEDVFRAMQQNNANTGGAYIVKDHRANFIRGEGLARSISDIESIVVGNRDGVPILIRDIAVVTEAPAIRYGAFTKNGKGEAVGGMILMLKDANSDATISAVKDRVAKIQQSLPKGIHIVPFLDRSELIEDTTSTVYTNLLEGGLIVIFILVLLLGNWRGGIVVASTIPLSLLFAFILMHAFGVWANLMSLGAIDFGIIVDGAVIIVESTVFMLSRHWRQNVSLDRAGRDDLAIRSSTKMMNAAFFGQLIILIVFVPILALEGVEGKMFQPMALTFMFAMLGAMLLCLTYVPMMSAWFIRVPKRNADSWGDKFVKAIESSHASVLNWCLKKANAILLVALAALIGTIFVFNRLGGEFIPQLDEGDIAFHIILKPGSSLEDGVAKATVIENILLKEFPEVEQVMSRFGVADVPTDPMPMDLADCFIILKPKSEWTSASSKSELIDKIKAAIGIVPGVSYEFTQPIEMRFNELLTGVREDIAIKIYGEDLDVLAKKAEEANGLIANLPGVGDIRTEATTGLPQIQVRYKRERLARYGIEVAQVNDLIKTAFAGSRAGVIFEGERRFDLVLRLKGESRSDFTDIGNLFISLEDGSRIPLNELATIDYTPGPMQISRDNTNRRTYVGINVRGNDVESLIQDIEERLNAQLDLPPGYYIRYGGAFENLERAKSRLQLVVPVALILIFVLIYFSLKNIGQTVMIFMAIPLAAIGGVLSLWLRDLPFSISAGVGFIVLFGVAVLNGLVLVSGLNELKEEGVTDIRERIRLGSQRRIRPILLTALTDIFGFLPMALSTGSGAEVQRPLATVVIGGLFTAGILTLIVIPILYKKMEERKLKLKPGIAVLLLTMLSTGAFAQKQVISHPDSFVNYCLKNHPEMLQADNQVEQAYLDARYSFDPQNTQIQVQYGQYDGFEQDLSFKVNQQIEFPVVSMRRRRLNEEKYAEQELSYQLTELELKKRLRQAWYNLAYLKGEEALLLLEDSLSKAALAYIEIQYKAEDINKLNLLSAKSKRAMVRTRLQQIKSAVKIQEKELQIMAGDTSVALMPASLRTLELDLSSMSSNMHPIQAMTKQQTQSAAAALSLARSKYLPDLSFGYFNQSLIGTARPDGSLTTMSDRFAGIQAGISIPLFFGAKRAAVKKAEYRLNTQRSWEVYRLHEFDLQKAKLHLKLLTHREEVATLQEIQSQSDELLNLSLTACKLGEISYREYDLLVREQLEIKRNYLNSLHQWNQSWIAWQYMLGQ